MLHSSITKRWTGTCIVAAPGPSLVAGVRGFPVIAVQDAYKLLPHAEILYGCDGLWWEVDFEWRKNHGVSFNGEQWSSHNLAARDDKRKVAERFGLQLVQGRQGGGFSEDPEYIHYGGNSGYQAINLAILFGATTILLIGFDMRHVEGKAHFFGNHPEPLKRCRNYGRFLDSFNEAAESLRGVRIINCTPCSALKCFPLGKLEDWLSGHSR